MLECIKNKVCCDESNLSVAATTKRLCIKHCTDGTLHQQHRPNAVLKNSHAESLKSHSMSDDPFVIPINPIISFHSCALTTALLSVCKTLNRAGPLVSSS